MLNLYMDGGSKLLSKWATENLETIYKMVNIQILLNGTLTHYLKSGKYFFDNTEKLSFNSYYLLYFVKSINFNIIIN